LKTLTDLFITATYVVQNVLEPIKQNVTVDELHY